MACELWRTSRHRAVADSCALVEGPRRREAGASPGWDSRPHPGTHLGHPAQGAQLSSPYSPEASLSSACGRGV